MSQETWLAEFAPVSPDSSEAQRAPAAYGLRKKLGLRREALIRHGLDPDNPPAFHESGCAQCIAHRLKTGSCDGCALYIVRGGVRCDRPRPDEDISPHHAFSERADPEPLIHWLRLAAEYEAEQQR